MDDDVRKPEKQKPVDQQAVAQKPAIRKQQGGARSSGGSAPPSRRPAGKRRKPAKKIDPTTAKLLGIFIFALGFAAVVAVAWLGYNKFSGGRNAQESGNVTGIASVFSAQDAVQQEESEQEASKLDLRKVSSETLLGTWNAGYGGRSAVFQSDQDGRFMITLFMDPEGYERRIAQGTIEYDEEEGVLSFKPSYDPLPEMEGVRISSLTMSPFRIIVLADSKTGDLIWTPPSGKNLRNHIHPLFIHMGRDKSFVRWKKARR